MASALAEARRGLRARRRRVIVTALGIALAAAMLSAAVVVADGLGLGFQRSAQAADLPDLIVRFNPQPASTVVQRIRALPDVAAQATRLELNNASISYGARHRDDAVAEVVAPAARRGYAVVAGRNLRAGAREVLVEQAFAQAWNVGLGSRVDVAGLGPLRVVGLVQAPDNVGFPLAKPRFYVSGAPADDRAGAGSERDGDARVNYAEVWLRNPAFLNEVLVQARDTSFGLRNLRFATRSGVRVLLDQAAGIVIDLLVALSLIALVTAGVMLAASARAEVQRRLGAMGVERAVGASGGYITLASGLEAALVAAPAATIGCAGGAIAVYGPAQRLLTLLNEPAPGTGLVAPLTLCWIVAVGLPVAGVAWPAWRAARQPVVNLLRGGDVARRPGPRHRPLRRLAARAPARGGGPGLLGARLVAARRVRLVATVVTLGLSTGFVLLMLSLASALSALETDPAALGKHYQLTATLPPASASRVRRVAGVEAVAPRYELEAVDSFSLGETVDVVAYPGDHTRFEAPPLVSGRRLRGSGQAEVGQGLAQALGLAPGQVVALQLPNGHELRLRVAGVVSSLAQEGRVAYVPAAALVRADPAAPSQLAVVLTPGGDQRRVVAALTALGAQPATAAGATDRGGPLVAVLRTILRAVAIVDGLVCLYALIQACALTVQERRRTVAVLRAVGGGSGAVRRLLVGAALALVIPAAAVGVALERFVFGPALSRLAVNYANLPLAATGAEVLVTVAGLLAAAALAVLWVARQAGRESVVAGLSA
ncbi:MAG TPA: ABC transporter permease [Solirubrobacteraceae bacterium]|nr:ABC transporter permease [Solirubrobacteraceae bacterium]